jgi:hypothetical protein
MYTKMYTNRFFSLLVAVALAVVAILTALDGIATSNVASDSLETLGMQKNWTTDAARWAVMGEYYQNRVKAENLTRSRTADAARWEAMGRYYQEFGHGASLNLLRSRAADTARWTAMAEYYQKLAKAEAQYLVRSRAADVARWTAMGQYYAQFGATTP